MFDVNYLLLVLVIIVGVLLVLDYLTLGRRRRRHAERERTEYFSPFLIRYLRVLFAALLFLFAMNAFLLQVKRVNTGSFAPIVKRNDYVIVNMIGYGIHFPFRPGYVWRWSEPPEGAVLLVYVSGGRAAMAARVVGLPGDEVTELNQRFYVNGDPIVKGHVLFNTDQSLSQHQLREGKSYYVAINQVLVVTEHEGMRPAVIQQNDVIGRILRVFFHRDPVSGDKDSTRFWHSVY